MGGPEGMDDSKEVSSNYNRINACRTHRDRGSLCVCVCGVYMCFICIQNIYGEGHVRQLVKNRKNKKHLNISTLTSVCTYLFVFLYSQDNLKPLVFDPSVLVSQISVSMNQRPQYMQFFWQLSLIYLKLTLCSQG